MSCPTETYSKRLESSGPTQSRKWMPLVLAQSVEANEISDTIGLLSLIPVLIFRLETLGDRLRVRGGPAAAARQVMRQPILWSVPPQHIQ
eukprot:scaffold126208_cov17-Tisochrysis_lutea.AAC.1